MLADAESLLARARAGDTAALGQLPEAYREVIILRHLEGLGFPDVARRLSRSLDSVKNLWARALGQLRRSLGEAP
jgi:RNA polymerase sigma-70 factor, ECF subfamily